MPTDLPRNMSKDTDLDDMDPDSNRFKLFWSLAHQDAGLEKSFKYSSTDKVAKGLFYLFAMLWCTYVLFPYITSWLEIIFHAK